VGSMLCMTMGCYLHKWLLPSILYIFNRLVHVAHPRAQGTLPASSAAVIAALVRRCKELQVRQRNGHHFEFKATRDTRFGC
jgi:hypothetical protein